MRLSDLEDIARDLRTSVEKLTAKVEAARSEPDPFAAHYFAARKSYRHASDTANKGGAKIERDLISSYRVAMGLGYKGSIREWEALLLICLR